MDELKNEIKLLRSQVNKLKALYLTTILAFVSGMLIFGAQYIHIFSYYKSTADINEEIIINQKYLNSVLEKYNSTFDSLMQLVEEVNTNE